MTDGRTRVFANIGIVAILLGALVTLDIATQAAAPTIMYTQELQKDLCFVTSSSYLIK